jgi:hypothetical protein
MCQCIQDMCTNVSQQVDLNHQVSQSYITSLSIMPCTISQYHKDDHQPTTITTMYQCAKTCIQIMCQEHSSKCTNHQHANSSTKCLIHVPKCTSTKCQDIQQVCLHHNTSIHVPKLHQQYVPICIFKHEPILPNKCFSQYISRYINRSHICTSHVLQQIFLKNIHYNKYNATITPLNMYQVCPSIDQ